MNKYYNIWSIIVEITIKLALSHLIIMILVPLWRELGVTSTSAKVIGKLDM